MARDEDAHDSLTDEYLDRLRERLAAGALSDSAFDCLLPPATRAMSTLHWTPLEVARAVADRLAQRGARRVLDAGSGPGKFCVVAACRCPGLELIGIEQRLGLVAIARQLASRLRVRNANFYLGDALASSWSSFDGFYLYNPFAENALGAHDVFDADAKASKLRFRTEQWRVAQRLQEARVGSVLVTYHGLGGPIPSSYDLTAEEDSCSGKLRTWIKNRTHEEPWVHLEHGRISRARWSASANLWQVDLRVVESAHSPGGAGGCED